MDYELPGPLAPPPGGSDIVGEDVVAVGVPDWAIWVFAGCTLLIVAVLLLDYFVIRRNALGNTCCGRGGTKKRSNQASNAGAHQKRSTNMLLNKMTRVTYDLDA